MSIRPARTILLTACVAAPALLFAPRGVLAQTASPLLARVFSDHAVIQRDVPVVVRGSAEPGEPVRVELAGNSGTAVADDSGHWEVVLPALPAGGPLVLSAFAEGGAAQRVYDILVGEVFLCSGQSNMVLPVSRTRFGAFEAMRANEPEVRMMTVPNAFSPVPLDELPEGAAWEVASPETVPDWSGTCWYFARDLRRGPLSDIPVGLVVSAWGGSSIRPWMDPVALGSVGGYDEALDVLDLYARDERAAQESFGRLWEAWWLERSGGRKETAPWQPGAGADWPAAPDGLGDWTAWDGMRGFTGMVWFRTEVDLTAEQTSNEAVLHLGAVDEVDQTWVNGHVVGNTFGYGTVRDYAVPAGMLREGRNEIVTNVLNTWAAGGLTGDHSVRALEIEGGPRLPLARWLYVPVREIDGYPPRAPWEAVGGLSTIHNAMVAPLADFGLAGVLWYQGESDTGSGGEYADLLRALIGQWRRQFGRSDRPLPAFVVQLPNFGAVPTEPVESGWAEVREAQRLAVRDDPRAAIAVTIDVGDPGDLHPPNKQAVGERLARAARSVLYGEAISPSGPVPVSAESRGDVVVVRFEDVENGLVAYSGAGPIGFEVCGEGIGTCRYADARVHGSEVIIRVEDDKPVRRIRYAWADSPIVTLFDGSGLPVGPFEMAVGGSYR